MNSPPRSCTRNLFAKVGFSGCARQLGVEMWEMAWYLLELSLCEYAEVHAVGVMW